MEDFIKIIKRKIYKIKVLNIPYIWMSLLFCFLLFWGEKFIDYGWFYAGIFNNKSYLTIKYLFTFLVIYIFAILGDKIFTYLFSKKYNINISNKKMYLVVVAILLALWCPYFIVLFPGSAWWDCGTKISMFFGQVPYWGTHPVLQTFFTGLSIKLGIIIGNANYGVALYCFLQMIIASVIISLGTVSLYLRYKKIAILILTILFWGLNPIFPLNIISMGVDCNWSLVFLGLYILICESKYNKEFIKKRWFRILFAILLILFCLLRNAGIYLVILFPILLIFYFQKQTKVIVLTTVVALLIVYTFNSISSMLLNIDYSVGKGNNYTIVVMQMARYIEKHKGEITFEEVGIINKVFDYDTIENKYEPQIADSLIASTVYNQNATNYDIMQFLKLWIKYFEKDPFIYFDAVGAKSIGYYNPFDKGEVRPYVILGLEPIYEQVNEDVGISLINLLDLKNIKSFVKKLSELPILRMITRCGFWTWMLIFTVFGAIVHKKEKTIFIPILIFSIGLIAVPANAYFRYILPIVFIEPYLLLYVYAASYKK